MYTVSLLAVVATMVLGLIRAWAGPTVFDRILALNMFGTKTVIFISVVSFRMGRTDYLDLALLYSLMNFIGTIAVLRFAKFGMFSGADSAVLPAMSRTVPSHNAPSRTAPRGGSNS